MELKVKTSKWNAGLPVAMLHSLTARKMGVHPGNRVLIQTYKKKKSQMIAILDTIEGRLAGDFLGVSNEIKKRLNLREGEKIEVTLATTTESVNFIKKKLTGRRLSKTEIEKIIEDVVSNHLSEAEIAVFVSAMYEHGMDFEETVDLINSILKSGKKVNFRNKYVVDKHCIGGIAGNRTTPLVVSICASLGLTFPKTSSRAITSAAGTADTIEVLSPVDFSIEEIKKIVKKAGACLVWGGGLGMVPADSKIIKVEKMLNLDPQAQLLASIMSKKISVGSKYLVIDIPYGPDAKVSKREGKNLKKKFEELAHHFGIKIKVVLTSSIEPIGNGIGPALEIRDVLKILERSDDAPKDLEEKSVYLAGLLLELTGKAKRGKGEKMARDALYSQRAYNKFKEIIRAQGGKVLTPKLSNIFFEIKADKKGKVRDIDNRKINSLARVLGCPVDKFAGVYLHKHVGEKVKVGDKIITLYAQSKVRLKEGTNYWNNSKIISF